MLQTRSLKEDVDTPVMSPKKPVSKHVSVRRAGEPVPPSPSLRLYRRIAFGFVAVVAVLLVIVVYVSTVQADILVTPTVETVKTNFLLDVVRTPTADHEIRGRVLSTALSRTATYQPGGQGAKTVIGTARGTVTLHNETGSRQPLVRTTRLLAPDGTLMRLDVGVTVPAHGTVDAPAYADKKGASGDLPAGTHFTIPGLNAAKQAVIYADNAAAFTGGEAQVAAIGQVDIDQAANDLKGKLTADAEAALRQQADDTLKGVSYDVTVVSQKTSVPVGTQADHFDLSMTLQVVGVFYDQAAVQDLASRRLFQNLPAGKRFSNVNAAGLQVTVEKVDLTGERANIQVYLDGQAVPSTASAGLDPARFAGMTADQVKKTLVDEGLATDVQVKFTPPFIRTVPRFKDHITVELTP